MDLRQIIVALLCLSPAVQQIAAVVNSVQANNATSPTPENTVEELKDANATIATNTEEQPLDKRDAGFTDQNSSESYAVQYGVPHPPKTNAYHGLPPHPHKFNPPKAYGPPSFNYINRNPKPIYGPPRPFHKFQKPHFGPKPFLSHPPKQFHKFQKHPPKSKFNGRYGLPDPVPHGPPHPGIPAPPTPPDIKYDGWQPIPGLVSRPPQQEYNVAEDFVPPPLHVPQILDLPREPYDVPLHPEATADVVPILPVVDDSLSIVQSAGFELYPHSDVFQQFGHAQLTPPSLPPVVSYGAPAVPVDSYGAPPLNSYTPEGPYALPQTSQQPFGLLSFPEQHFGLVPPSGEYGVPQQEYVPHSKPSQHPLNALSINPPKHPVVFREPVPPGLIESIGNSVAQKDAHGVIESGHYSSGPTYIPPPVPDLSKPVHHGPSGFYNQPTSFQNVQHGKVLNSYNAPSGIVDGSYGLHQAPADSAHAGTSTHLRVQNAPRSCSNQQQYDDLRSIYNGIQQPPKFQANSDLQSSYSLKSQSFDAVPGSRNALQDPQVKAYTKGLLSDFGPDAQLAQSVSLPEIPLKGKLGTYSIQIQGSGGNSRIPVPHDQILNEELLQSILAAIEKPDVQEVTGETLKVTPFPPVNNTTAGDRSVASPSSDVAIYFKNVTDYVEGTTQDVRNGQQYGIYNASERD